MALAVLTQDFVRQTLSAQSVFGISLTWVEVTGSPLFVILLLKETVVDLLMIPLLEIEADRLGLVVAVLTSASGVEALVPITLFRGVAGVENLESTECCLRRTQGSNPETMKPFGIVVSSRFSFLTRMLMLNFMTVTNKAYFFATYRHYGQSINSNARRRNP